MLFGCAPRRMRTAIKHEMCRNRARRPRGFHRHIFQGRYELQRRFFAMKAVRWGGRTAAESSALQHKSHPLLNALKSITNWPSGQCRGRIFFRPRQPWHVGCIPARSGTRVASFACDLLTSFALTPLRDGGSAYRRPPVWRAVVRPARYFFIRQKVAYGAFCRV